MKINRFIYSFYLFQFLFDFILIYAVEKLFLLSRGVDLFQIGILLFFWSVLSLIFEIPTGTLADKWNRRKMLILSGIFFSICYLLWIFSNSFWIFLLGFVFRTLGGTFASGTLQAYVYDFLKTNNKEEDFEKIWGRGNSLRTLGIGFAVLLGGFLSQFSYELTLLVSAISVSTISLIAYFWPDVKPIGSTGEEKYLQILKGSFNTIRGNYSLLHIIFYTVIIFTAFATLEEFNDVYLKFLGYPNSQIGIVFFLATVGQSIASSVAHKFKNISWMTLNMTAILGILILIMAAFIKHPLMAIAILFLGIMLEFSRVLNEGIIQKEVPSSQRATVSSVNSFVSNLIPLQIIFGYIASKYQFQWSYGLLAIFTTFYFLLLPFLKKSKANLVPQT